MTARPTRGIADSPPSYLERAETSPPRHLSHKPVRLQFAQQRGPGLRRDPELRGERLGGQRGGAQQGVDGVRQPRAFVAAGDQPPALFRRAGEPLQFTQARRPRFGCPVFPSGTATDESEQEGRATFAKGQLTGVSPVTLSPNATPD
jgi:hypothetical protein